MQKVQSSNDSENSRKSAEPLARMSEEKEGVISGEPSLNVAEDGDSGNDRAAHV